MKQDSVSATIPNGASTIFKISTNFIMKHILLRLVTFGLLTAFARIVSAQTPATNSPPAGKIAAHPLYRDPVFDHPTDPVVVYNAESKRWLMYYTQRRGGSIALIHGTKIGIAASDDGGATWNYIGTADITYGQDQYPTNYTYWAPEVIWVKGQYHMFLAFVPGIFNDWNHPREIGHLTSKDGIKWTTVGKVDLQSNKVIDPCVIQLPDGTWRMFYKDEASATHHNVCYADSTDLNTWTVKGNAVTDRNGEGENCIRFKGKYWLLADTDRPGGPGRLVLRRLHPLDAAGQHHLWQPWRHGCQWRSGLVVLLWWPARRQY